MELLRKYAEARDKRIGEELYELAHGLETMEKEQRGRASFWSSLTLRRRSCERQSTFVQMLYWVLIVLIAFLSQTANAQTADCTLFVSANNGSDNNDGRSLGSAFKTIQKAAWVVNPGDVVCVDDGVYKDEYFGTIPGKTGSGGVIVGLERGGTAQSPIIFRSINKWGAILDGQKNATHVCWSIGEDDPNTINPIGYVRIESFELRGCNGFGFNIGGWSMASKVHDLTVYGNHIHDMGRELYASFYGRGIGIGATDFVDNMTIDSNVLHHLGRLKHTTVGNCRNITGPDIEGHGGWYACHDYRHDHGLYLGGYYRGGAQLYNRQ